MRLPQLAPRDLELIACPGCDLLQRMPSIPRGAAARCPRCDDVLAHQPYDPIDWPLALVVAAAIVFIVANVSPLMTVSAAGRESDTTIIGGAYAMWIRGHQLTAVVVAFCAVVAPAAYIGCTLAVLLGARRAPAPRWVALGLRWADALRPWSMNEVMLLGVLVAQIRIAAEATVIVGIGMYAAGVLVVLLAATIASFEPREVWRRIEWADPRAPRAAAATSADPRPATP